MVVYLPSPDRAEDVVVRLRLRPDAAERDYRGERYTASLPASARPEMRPRVPAGSDEPRLLDAAGEDRTPPTEPLPALTVDRLVRVHLDPGATLHRRVTLEARCIGRMSDLASGRTCIAGVDADADAGDRQEDGSPSVVGGWLGEALRGAGEVTREDAVSLPGGAFVLGSAATLSPAWASTGDTLLESYPPRVALVRPFAIDRTEVSARRFRDALARGFRPKSGPVDNDGPLATSSASPTASCTYRSSSDPTDPARDDLPVTCVTFATARAFCLFEGGDLPSEAQWEYAAAVAGRERKSLFPWGDTAPECATAVFGRFDSGNGDSSCHALGFAFGLRDATTVTGDRTPSGVLGLGGGAAEWVRGAPLPYDAACFTASGLVDAVCEAPSSEQVVRGGSFLSPREALVTTLRWKVPEGGSSSLIGFRCVHAQ